MGAMACRTDAFGGSDVPYTSAESSVLSTGLPGTNPDGGTSGCDLLPYTFTGHSTNTGIGFQPAYTPQPNSLTAAPFYPNGGFGQNQVGQMMAFPVSGGAVGVAAHLISTGAGCTIPTTLQFSVQTLSDIMGGKIGFWDDPEIVNENAGLSGCHIAVVRVVRACIPNDRAGQVPVGTTPCQNTLSGSGTTFSLKTFLQDDLPSLAQCDGTSTWSTLGQNVPNNAIWPTGAGCSALVRSCAIGGGNLIKTVQNTNDVNGAPTDSSSTSANCVGSTDFTNFVGCTAGTCNNANQEPANGQIGYADISDWKSKTGVILASIQTHDDFGAHATCGTPTTCTYITPAPFPLGATNSNCNLNVKNLPTPITNNNAVGLGAFGSAGTWATDDTGKFYDITNSAGSVYPICALTWDFVYTHLNGRNVTATSAVSGAQNLPLAGATGTLNLTTTSVTVPGLAGLPTSGATASLQVTETDNTTVPPTVTTPTETITWTGITGNQLTGVSCAGCAQTTGGATYAASDHAAVTFPNVKDSGGPIQGLTANQRRTLYSFFAYTLSPTGQAALNNTLFDPLPSSWLSFERGGFTANF
jgi:hypothetical protein